MNLAIVGSQGKSFSFKQETDAYELINLIIGNYYRLYENRMEGLLFVSGGEPTGVDIWAETEAVAWGIPIRIHYPEAQNWLAFKKRNILIANDADVLYAIRSTASTTFGSGWTANYAEKLGKEVHRYYV